MSFTVGRCRVRLDFAFFALAAAMLTASAAGGGNLLGLYAAIIHESGHIIALLLQGGTPERIKADASGLHMTVPDSHRSAFVLAAGAAVNFAAFVISMPFSVRFAAANLLTGLMNLTPVRPLDGGELLLLFLIKKKSAEKAASISNVISFAASVPLLTAGLYILFISKWNITLLIIALCLILRIFSDL